MKAAPGFAAIAARLQPFVDKGEIAGAVTLVATKDQILHLGAVGKSDLAKDRKMKTDDIFWIASMSKPITAVCIAILVDDGKLNFDDPLAKQLLREPLLISQDRYDVELQRRHDDGSWALSMSAN